MDNYIYVEDNGQGTVCVYDDNDTVPERKFTYSAHNRVAARVKAEDHASSQAKTLGCLWGRNYK